MFVFKNTQNGKCDEQIVFSKFGNKGIWYKNKGTKYGHVYKLYSNACMVETHIKWALKLANPKPKD